MLAYRLVRGGSVVAPRSFCPYCKEQLAWYDLIPVISWLLLFGKCRKCATPISFLYPFIELLTAVVMALLFLRVPMHYFPAYFIFFSALIVTIRSDAETMLISRFVTLFLVPLGVLFSIFGLLPITLVESILGFFLGYGFLYMMGYIAHKFTGKQGLGQGDLELLSFIGSFIGPFGCWVTLLIGSVVGSFVGILYLTFGGVSRDTKIPFGPFLALGALIFVLCNSELRLLFTSFSSF